MNPISNQSERETPGAAVLSGSQVAVQDSGVSPAIRFIGFLNRSGLLLALIILFVVLSLTAPNFLTSRNLLNVVRQVAFVGIIACGMTLVMIAAEVDLSVGSMVAFSSSLLGFL